MKKTLYILFVLLLSASIIYGVFIFMKNHDETNQEEQTYVFENKLIELGYTNDEIKNIGESFTEEEVNKYLLTKKYNSLLSYKESKLFNIEHLDRYLNYEIKSKKETANIVTYVEIGLDTEFYTNISEITDYNNKLVLVNKYNKLPSNYEASNLVTLNNTYSSNSQKVKVEVSTELIKMFDSAKEEGLSMKVISGYRTENTQNNLFTSSTKKNGLEHALMYSAKPGHSEHQTGFAIDINIAEEKFKDTDEYEWLKLNSHKYGFIERYPQGKEFITGYGYEPWHYRFVGVEVATIIHENSITFEEYKALY